MNAGRDVERLIADWFVEEAVLRAPDRILDEAGRVIDRTKQRRINVAWRNPLMSALRRVAAAAVLTVLVVGGALLMFSDRSIGQPAPSPTSTAEPTAAQSITASPASTPRVNLSPSSDVPGECNMLTLWAHSPGGESGRTIDLAGTPGERIQPIWIIDVDGERVVIEVWTTMENTIDAPENASVIESLTLTRR